VKGSSSVRSGKNSAHANEFAIELGYRGNERNNDALIDRYENGSRQIPCMRGQAYPL